MSILERISALHEKGLLSSNDVRQLTSSDHQLNINVADKMIENVVGVFGLPMGVALNFLINNRLCCTASGRRAVHRSGTLWSRKNLAPQWGFHHKRSRHDIDRTGQSVITGDPADSREKCGGKKVRDNFSSK